MAFRQTVNLGNSIIGVSILTMPYCFRKCGILLSICTILVSGLINRAGCHLLLKSATITRKRNFELMAYEVFGAPGKLIVEIGILGFLVGTCVAFFVVIGDLGPALVAEIFDVPNGPLLRAFVMTFLGMFVALPLGLLRRVESLSSFSVLSLVLYTILITKLFSEASANLLTATEKELSTKINWWDWNGLLSNLPIFAMALSCQTQLFEIFDYSVLNFEDYNSVKRLNGVVKRAVNMCSLVYIMVGILGYVAFYEEPFGGNILIFLPPGFSSSLTKLGFVFTVVISLPLCLFPCRTSLHSLMFRKGTGSLLNEPSATAQYMSDHDFRLLTVALIVTTIGVSIIVPHIEVVLGIIGSTIGAVICFILPGLIFTHVTTKNTTERLMARSVTYIGFFILIACSYSTLRDAKILSAGDSVEIMKMEQQQPIIPDITVLEAKIPSNIPPRFDRKEPKLEVPVAVSSKPVTPLKPQLPIVIDPAKIKKQEELLVRLEKQQQEHKKLIEEQKQFLHEIKKHEEVHHAAAPEKSEDKPQAAEAPQKVAPPPAEAVKVVMPEPPNEMKSEKVVKKVPEVKALPPLALLSPNISKNEKTAPQKTDSELKRDAVPLSKNSVLTAAKPVKIPKAVSPKADVPKEKNVSDVKPEVREVVREPKRDTLSISEPIAS